jgi:hypothetical protein
VPDRKLDRQRVGAGGDYEPYPVLLDRTSSWATKEPLLNLAKSRSGDDDCARTKSNNREERQKKKAAK